MYSIVILWCFHYFSTFLLFRLLLLSTKLKSRLKEINFLALIKYVLQKSLVLMPIINLL